MRGDARAGRRRIWPPSWARGSAAGATRCLAPWPVRSRRPRRGAGRTSRTGTRVDRPPPGRHRPARGARASSCDAGRPVHGRGAGLLQLPPGRGHRAAGRRGVAAVSRGDELAANLAAVRGADRRSLRRGRSSPRRGDAAGRHQDLAGLRRRPAPRPGGDRTWGRTATRRPGRKAAAVPGVRWHFIGRLQSNKAASVASYSEVVHAAGPGVAVRAAGRRRDRRGPGAGRAGAGEPGRRPASAGERCPQQVPALADQVAATGGLRLLGVSAVAPLGADPAAAFAVLQQRLRGSAAPSPGRGRRSARA